ncbi:MAG: transcriptional repressor [Cyclobacteriaceae bacterium]|nr:transcriptional repressor [Cyclobacteriaceae bacterium]MCH8517307.1 transcriptional repressor [Cyclobacteriaceae bacterium]
MDNQTKDTLKNYDLRLTGCRADVLKTFTAHNHALSHAEIEQSIDRQYDRVTIYRTLKTFLEKGLIHKVPDDEGNLKYALCNHRCSSENHNHDHVHFKCVKCNNTLCIESVGIPGLPLPAGFTMIEQNVLVNGICKSCNS